jgi:hypothetical protein
MKDLQNHSLELENMSKESFIENYWYMYNLYAVL